MITVPLARRIVVVAVIATLLVPATLPAKVVRVVIDRREDVLGGRAWGPYGGYEKIVGRVFYDLADDPGEVSARPWDEAAGEGDAAARLESLVRTDPDPAGLPTRYPKGIRLKAPKVNPDVSREQLEALRALGYVE